MTTTHTAPHKNAFPYTRYAAYGETDRGIIGGGPLGLILAYFAMKAGESVTLVEREPILAPHTALYGDGIALPHHSDDPAWQKAQWEIITQTLPQLAAELGVTLHRSLDRGMIELATTKDGARDLAVQAQYLRDHGIAVDVLTADQLRERAPMLTDAFRASVTGAIHYAEPRLDDVQVFFDALIDRLRESPKVQIITGEQVDYIRMYRLSGGRDLQGRIQLCPAPQNMIFARGLEAIGKISEAHVFPINGIAIDAAASDPVTHAPTAAFKGPSILYRHGENLVYVAPSGDRTRARLGVTKVRDKFVRAAGAATFTELASLLSFLDGKITLPPHVHVAMTATGGTRECTQDGRPVIISTYPSSVFAGGLGGDWMRNALVLARAIIGNDTALQALVSADRFAPT